jgi:hypothetical protein
MPSEYAATHMLNEGYPPAPITSWNLFAPQNPSRPPAFRRAGK